MIADCLDGFYIRLARENDCGAKNKANNAYLLSSDHIKIVFCPFPNGLHPSL
jgi:hypothetical protein